jgi:hypothetical protein
MLQEKTQAAAALSDAENLKSASKHTGQGAVTSGYKLSLIHI